MVSNNYLPFTGGVVSSLRAFIPILQQRGNAVELATLSFLYTHDDPSWVKRLWCPIRFVYKTNHMAIPWRAKRQLGVLIDQFKPDIIHVHHPFLLGSMALKIARQKHIPVVFTYHTIYQEYTHYVPLPQTLVKKWVLRQVLSFCEEVNGIIAPGSYIMNNLEQQGVATPTVLIPSPLQPVFMRNGPISGKETGGPLRLLVVSRMVKEKNIEAVLQVAKTLLERGVSFSFKLIGYGSDFQTLKAYAYGQLRLPEDVVQFVHRPPKAEIAEAYRQANLFLFPSHTDTQGLVIAEAMAGSTPVVAFDGPGQRDIVKDGYNGFMVHSQQQMVERIILLDQQRSQLEALSKHAWQTAQNYRPEELAGRLEKFYRIIMGAR